MKIANSHRDITAWEPWFAWVPVETNDHGWRWLETVERRSVASDEFSGEAHEYRVVQSGEGGT